MRHSWLSSSLHWPSRADVVTAYSVRRPHCDPRAGPHRNSSFSSFPACLLASARTRRMEVPSKCPLLIGSITWKRRENVAKLGPWGSGKQKLMNRAGMMGHWYWCIDGESVRVIACDAMITHNMNKWKWAAVCNEIPQSLCAQDRGHPRSCNSNIE